MCSKVHILPHGEFRHTPSFLDLRYSDDLIVLEITFISGRPKEKGLKLLKALNDAVVSAIAISPDDLLITLYETSGENICFGRGLAQRANVQLETAVRAHPLPARSYSPRGRTAGRNLSISGSRRPWCRRRVRGSYCSRCGTCGSIPICAAAWTTGNPTQHRSGSAMS
jgi:Tautomerase enzyme